MSALSEFVLSRIADDEEVAWRNAIDWLAQFWPHVADDPEWEASMIDDWLRPSRASTPPAYRNLSHMQEPYLRWFAARYADHPDYRAEWTL